MAGTISLKHIYEIAKIKMGDLSADVAPGKEAAAAAAAAVGDEQICKVVAGSARSMGIRVVR